ncbi:hypothetical protein XENOCAPTIV_017198 [Xenoophorus captivus]|uniref:Uncharacterized protein n=1 Tax=Xenoophorus captivus TaxID=1517983 RepID=A0ABV0QAG1_9TELE
MDIRARSTSVWEVMAQVKVGFILCQVRHRALGVQALFGFSFSTLTYKYRVTIAQLNFRCLAQKHFKHEVFFKENIFQSGHRRTEKHLCLQQTITWVKHALINMQVSRRGFKTQAQLVHGSIPLRTDSILSFYTKKGL